MSDDEQEKPLTPKEIAAIRSVIKTRERVRWLLAVILGFAGTITVLNVLISSSSDAWEAVTKFINNGSKK